MKRNTCVTKALAYHFKITEINCKFYRIGSISSFLFTSCSSGQNNNKEGVGSM